ncbi:MAG: ABC transporter ATP-binding protein [Pseudomonadota bacterium]
MSVALPTAQATSAAAQSSAPLLTVTDVTKRFGGLLAVDGCSFAIREGSITGLIGPNGAGKTTLFNMVAGTFPPSGGRITFAGEDVTGLAPYALFRKGLVRTFQIPHEFHRMTVLENLLVVPQSQAGETVWNAWFAWGRIRDQERALVRRAMDVLNFLGMTHVKDVLAGHLSGGQKKLLELGRTMMTDARLVLLDEPGAGVNKTLLVEIAEFIRRLNRERGYTICIIEHDMDLIAALCDPVIVMAEGRVLMEGSMAEVRAHPDVLEAYLGQPTGAAA